MPRKATSADTKQNCAYKTEPLHPLHPLLRLSPIDDASNIWRRHIFLDLRLKALDCRFLLANSGGVWRLASPVIQLPLQVVETDDDTL